MIISKNALQLILLCSPDRAKAAFNCLCLEPNGAVAASNSQVYGWVSPLSAEKRKLVPLDDTPVGERIVLSADTVANVIKAIPKDTQFKGLLEHVDIELPEPGGMGVNIHIADARQRHVIHQRRVSFTYPNYAQVFREAWVAADHSGVPLCLNRKRLGNVMAVADKVCSYDGSFAPTWWHMCHDGTVIMRTVNELTDQRLICVFSASEADTLPLDDTEQALFAGSVARRGAIKIGGVGL